MHNACWKNISKRIKNNYEVVIFVVTKNAANGCAKLLSEFYKISLKIDYFSVFNKFSPARNHLSKIVFVT